MARNRPATGYTVNPPRRRRRVRRISPGVASTGHPRSTRPTPPRTPRPVARRAERQAATRTRQTLGHLGRGSRVTARVGDSRPLNKSRVYRDRRQRTNEEIKRLRRQEPGAFRGQDRASADYVAKSIRERRRREAAEKKDDGGGVSLGGVADAALGPAGKFVAAKVALPAVKKIADVADTKLADIPKPIQDLNARLDPAGEIAGTNPKEVTVGDALAVGAGGAGVKTATKLAPRVAAVVKGTEAGGRNATKIKSAGEAAEQATKQSAKQAAKKGASGGGKKPPKKPTKKGKGEEPKPEPRGYQNQPRTSAQPKKRGKLYKTGKVAATPIRVPAKHPLKTMGVLAAGASYSGAKKHGAEGAVAPFVGTAEALAHPKKTAATTARTLPGLITAPVGMAANLALTTGRAASTAAAKADIPGAREYSGKEIAAPAKKVGEETYDFGKSMAETFGSGDSKRIQKGIEEDFGLTPFLVAGIPGAKFAGKSPVARTAGRGVKKGGRKIATRRGREYLDNRKARKEEAREAAYADASKHWASEAAKPVIKNLRRVRGKKGKKVGDRKIDHADTLKVVVEEGIQSKAHAQKVRKRLGEKRREDADVITAHDVLDHIIENPQVLQNKHYQKALEAYRQQAREIEISGRAKHGKQAITWGVKLPEQRFLKQRAEAKKLPKKQREKKLAEIEAKADAAFEKAIAKKREKEGLAEAAYTGDYGLDFASRILAEPPYPVRGARKPHRTEFVQSKTGRADQSFARLVQTGFRNPRVGRALHERTTDFINRAALKVKVKGPKGEREMAYLTSQEVAKLKFDPKKYAVIDSQQFRQAVLDPETEGGAVAAQIAMREGEAARRLKLSKGKKYVVVERARAKEFFDQMKGLDTWGQKLSHGSQRAASRAVLGYSPSWLMAQPIAESIQGLAAVTNPIRHIQGRKALNKMTPEQRRKFREQVGATSGTSDIRQAIQTLDPRSKDFNKDIEFLGRNPASRVARGLATGRYASNLDRRKGAAIREQVAAAHLAREFSTFRNGIKGLIGYGKKFDKMPLEQRLKHFSKRENGRQLEKYVDDVMGNWRALTKNERSLSAAVVFYPFVRMSLSWVFHSYPKRHPIKASIQHFLAQAQAEQIEAMYGGNPSFFTGWADTPLYAGKDGKATSAIPLSRMAPGSNAFTEAVGGNTGITGAVRGLNPIAGALLNAYAGQDPLTGRSLTSKGEKMSDPERLKLALATGLSMPAPIRIAGNLDLPKVGRAIPKLQGKSEDAPTTTLMRMLGGGDGRKVLQGLVPFVPKNVAKERQKAEIGRLLKRKYSVPDDPSYYYEKVRPAAIAATKGGKDPKGTEAEELIVKMLDSAVATKVLNKLYERYGIRGLPDLTGRAQDLAQASKPTEFSPPYRQLMYDALGMRENSYPTGLKGKRLRKLRRARARKIMGNNWTKNHKGIPGPNT